MSDNEETAIQEVGSEPQELPVTPLGDLEPLVSRVVKAYSERTKYFMSDMKKRIKEAEDAVLNAKKQQADIRRRRASDDDAGTPEDMEEIDWPLLHVTLIDLKASLEAAHASVQNIHRWEVDTERVDKASPGEIDWNMLDAAFAEDAPRAFAAWERLKQTAIEEAESGNRAAGALYQTHSPWERAQFLALWFSIHDEVEPRGGMELALVDTMALAFAQHLAWLTTADNVRAYEAKREEKSIWETRKWGPPVVADVDWIRLAAEMADRYQRMFIRAARTFRDLRRVTPSVTVQAAGQVNVGAQQVNLS